MKNFSKAGLLIVTLVIPALIFAYLNFFAKNHYILPYYFPAENSHGKIIVENGDTLFRKISSICPELDRAGLDKSITIVSSLPETCDDQCKIVLSQLERIVALKEGISQLLILTTAEQDPGLDNDFPTAMGKEGWKVIVTAKDLINCFQNENINKVAGDSRLLLIDNEGFVRGFYDGTNATEIDRLMAEIKILDYETQISAQ